MTQIQIDDAADRDESIRQAGAMTAMAGMITAILFVLVFTAFAISPAGERSRTALSDQLYGDNA